MKSHAHSAFLTLTYRDEELTDVSGQIWNASRPVVPTLVKRDLQLWLKRVRRMAENHDGRKLRFFAVGEYGDQTQRPHYHVALFGFPSCLYGQTRMRQKSCCQPCDMLKKTWEKGSVHVGELNAQSAMYLTGYVSKKWTKEDTWTRQKLKGRTPEFVRMSLNPGIGAIALGNLIATGVQSPRLGATLKQLSDAPVAWNVNGKMYALGRYLRRKFREALGRDPETPKSAVSDYMASVMADYGSTKSKSRDGYYRLNHQKIKNREVRLKIFQKGKKL